MSDAHDFSVVANKALLIVDIENDNVQTLHNFGDQTELHVELMELFKWNVARGQNDFKLLKRLSEFNTAKSLCNSPPDDKVLVSQHWQWLEHNSSCLGDLSENVHTFIRLQLVEWFKFVRCSPEAAEFFRECHRRDVFVLLMPRAPTEDDALSLEEQLKTLFDSSPRKRVWCFDSLRKIHNQYRRHPMGCDIVNIWMVNKDDNAFIKSDELKVMPDLRIFHIRQLLPLMELIRCIPQNASSGVINLSTIKSYIRQVSDNSSNAAKDNGTSSDQRLPIIVAYLLVPAKARRFHAQGILDSNRVCIFVPLSARLPLAPQLDNLSARPDLFFFKVSDFLAVPSNHRRILEELVDVCDNRCSTLQHSLKPTTRVITPLGPQRCLLDRSEFLKVLNRCCLRATDRYGAIRVANHAVLSLTDLACESRTNTVLADRCLSWPCICKALLGGGPDVSHRIGVVYNYQGLTEFAGRLTQRRKEEERLSLAADTQTSTVNAQDGHNGDSQQQRGHGLITRVGDGVVVQEIIQHRDVVYKVFCLGNAMFMAKHPTLPEPKLQEQSNIINAPNFVEYNSMILKSKPHTNPILPALQFEKLDAELKVRTFDAEGKRICVEAGLDEDLLRVVCEEIVEAFEMIELFGFDVLVESSTKSPVLVDLNFFPSYSNANRLPDTFLRFLVEQSCVAV